VAIYSARMSRRAPRFPPSSRSCERKTHVRSIPLPVIPFPRRRLLAEVVRTYLLAAPNPRHQSMPQPKLTAKNNIFPHPLSCLIDWFHPRTADQFSDPNQNGNRQSSPAPVSAWPEIFLTSHPPPIARSLSGSIPPKRIQSPLSHPEHVGTFVSPSHRHRVRAGVVQQNGNVTQKLFANASVSFSDSATHPPKSRPDCIRLNNL